MIGDFRFISISTLYLAVFFTLTLPQCVHAGSGQFPTKQDWFFGGGIGLGIGDVDYIEVSPLVGYNINPRVSAGLSLLYRYRKDNRFNESQSTNDYGATVFGRFFIIPRVYLQAEYEFLDYEVYRLNSSSERKNFGSVLAGGGASMPVGGNASLYATALYNFSYDKVDSPYSEPLVLRFGVGIGF